MVITLTIRNHFDKVVKEAHIQPFSGPLQTGPCKIVPLDVVGHQMVEQVLNDLTVEVRKM
jgi:hypothetical protein